MLQNLLPLLPRRIGTLGITMAGGSLLLGCGFWLAGARFSRPLLAVAATLGGGAIGFQSPQWLAWKLDPWSVAMLGALLFGIAGYLAYRYIQAAGLGLLLAFAAALASVACVGLDTRWEWPDFSAADSLGSYAVAVQRSLPTHLVILLLYAAGIAGVFGVGLGVVFHRLGSVLFWSLLGTFMMLFAAVVAAQSSRIQVMRMIPDAASEQSALLGAIVALGAAVQWKFAFAKKPRKAAAPAQSPVIAATKG